MSKEVTGTPQYQEPPSEEEGVKRSRFRTPTGGRNLLHDEPADHASYSSLTKKEERPSVSGLSDRFDLQAGFSERLPKLPHALTLTAFQPDGTTLADSGLLPSNSFYVKKRPRTFGLGQMLHQMPRATSDISSSSSSHRQSPYLSPILHRPSPLMNLHRIPLKDDSAFVATSATGKHEGPSGGDPRIYSGPVDTTAARRSALPSPPKSIYEVRRETTKHRSYDPGLTVRTDSSRSALTSDMPTPADDGEAGQAMGSSFNRPPSSQALKPKRRSREHLAVSPGGNVHPEREPHHAPVSSEPASRPSSPVGHSATQAWFALGTNFGARDTQEWSSDLLRAYNAGIEDAIRAMESGVVGVGNQHYRHPIMIRTGRADEAADGGLPLDCPSGERSRSAHWDGPMPTPLRPWSTTGPSHPYHRHSHPHSPPSNRYHSFHPHSISPYDFAYPPHSSLTTPSSNNPARHSSHDSYYHTSSRGFYSTPGGGPGRSQRQLISCYPCRRRKLKCDGAIPCAQCLRRGNEAECAYATHVRRRGKGKRKDDDESSTGSSRLGSVEMVRGYGSSDSYDPMPKNGGVASGNETRSKSYRKQWTPDGVDTGGEAPITSDVEGNDGMGSVDG